MDSDESLMEEDVERRLMQQDNVLVVDTILLDSLDSISLQRCRAVSKRFHDHCDDLLTDRQLLVDPSSSCNGGVTRASIWTRPFAFIRIVPHFCVRFYN